MNSLPRFAVLVFLLCTLVYANALFDGFVYDDFDLVVNNHWAREGSLLDAFHEGFWETSRGGSFYYRPVVSVSYWVGRHLWGTRPFGYHLINILLHAGASILLLLLAVRWTGSRSAAAAAAA
ncbi:MAG TPA: hypothetical protein VNI57_07390, partial [Candidatus Saccharimonadales bacterium]|nr:hypothetical protein [Candidatus Saccharimonadales bacterium]